MNLLFKKLYTFALLMYTGVMTQGQELNEAQLLALKTDDTTLFKSAFTTGAYHQCFHVKEGLYSPLLLSIKMDKPQVFRFLLAQNADINKMCDDKTPLMYAAKYGNVTFASMLLDKGADAGIVNPEGKTAKDYAKNYKQLQVYDLLSNGANTRTISSDGPVVLQEGGKLVQYGIVPAGNHVALVKKVIGKNSILSCYVDETKDSFSFWLKTGPDITASEYKQPAKMLVISDIEGNFKGLKAILQGNKITDKNFNWTFGNNHLVLVGDFFDRGLHVTECLWLIYKLETEAGKHGGKVHFLLGNHEIMNMKGQLKYVRKKYTANADTLKLAYEKWYAQNSELGKWLRTKNGVEKIGNILFVHAGIGKNFPHDLTLSQINDGIRQSIDAIPAKEATGDNVFIGRDGPLWYRGIASEEETQEDIDKTLSRFKADKMVIGHTVMDSI